MNKRKKILFAGEFRGNNGVNNVNKKIIANLDNKYYYIKSQNKLFMLLELTFKCMRSDVIVLSGLSAYGKYSFKLAKAMNKKTVYIMHGSVEQELSINNYATNEESVGLEKKVLDSADLILPVSERFKSWVAEKYPQYESKLVCLYNGIEKQDMTAYHGEKISGRIIALGGDLKCKNNAVLSNAVEKIDSDCKLLVFGEIISPKQLPENPRTQYMGMIPQEQVYLECSKAQVFVLNSIFETFSIAAIEALNCGCSVLLSDVAGVCDILELEDTDIIFDPMNQDEIAEKIQYLMKHPNYRRISEKIDFEELSYKSEVKKLTKLCDKL